MGTRRGQEGAREAQGGPRSGQKNRDPDKNTILESILGSRSSFRRSSRAFLDLGWAFRCLSAPILPRPGSTCSFPLTCAGPSWLRRAFFFDNQVASLRCPVHGGAAMSRRARFTIRRPRQGCRACQITRQIGRFNLQFKPSRGPARCARLYPPLPHSSPQHSTIRGHFLNTLLGPVFVFPNRRPEPLFFRFWIPIMDPVFYIFSSHLPFDF